MVQLEISRQNGFLEDLFLPANMSKMSFVYFSYMKYVKYNSEMQPYINAVCELYVPLLKLFNIFKRIETVALCVTRKKGLCYRRENNQYDLQFLTTLGLSTHVHKKTDEFLRCSKKKGIVD